MAMPNGAHGGGSGSAGIQSVMIPRAEKRATPSPHVVYAILVTLSVRSWTVFRRYSDFLALEDALAGTIGPTPAPLPPKHGARRTLRAITGLGGLLSQGEGSVAADEALVEQRRIALERYVRAIVASQDARWRETSAFREFLEIPPDVHVNSMLGQQSQQKYVPGSYTSRAASKGSALDDAQAKPKYNTPTTRTFGAPKQSIEESDMTRPLDDRGLMQSQQEQMDAQDQQLEGLTAILRRQRAMGMSINQELNEQSELLEGLDHDVDRTQGKMRKEEAQMDRLR